MMKAVIDRFEGKTAVLLVGQEEQRMDVPRARLPRGSKEGAWLQVKIQGNEVIEAKLDEEETNRAKQRIAEKLEALRRGDHLKKDS